MSDSSNEDALMARLQDLEDRLDWLSREAVVATDLDVVWIIVSAVLVFFMQVGFAMLEVGSVSPKNTKAVLLKNIGDASLGALCWWLVGFALAYGTDKWGFAGTDMFALNGRADEAPGIMEAKWMFDWAFAATSVTIVSGAIAERVKIAAYVMYAIALTSFIYPLVVHWAWHSHGWASPMRESSPLAGCGAADFAGSGVVHMVGGTAALVAARAVKARRGRFRPDGSVARLQQQSPALQTLGTLILWVGWYAFNSGSSLTVSDGRSVVAARAVVTTTIGPSAGVLVMVVALKVLEKKFDTRGVNNGILSGLVAITAGAPLINPEGAFVIGVISAVVYYCSADVLLKLGIDDVVDAAPVHLFCGMWGLVGTALFTTREGWALTYGEDRADKCCGLFYGCGGRLLAANLCLMATILAWVVGTSSILFWTIEKTVGLRVPPSEEEAGMDRTRHSSATGSFATDRSKHSSYGAYIGGSDAVRRAITKAQWGFIDEASHGGSHSRSQPSSRAGSLSTSKHGDLSAVAAGGGKHGDLQSWGVMAAAAAAPNETRGALTNIAAENNGGRGGGGGGRSGSSAKTLFSRATERGVDLAGATGNVNVNAGAGAFTQQHLPAMLAEGGGSARSMNSEAMTPCAGRGVASSYVYRFGGGAGFGVGASNSLHHDQLGGRAVEMAATGAAAAAATAEGGVNHGGVVDDHEVAGGGRSQPWPRIIGGSNGKDGRRRSEEKVPDPNQL